MFPDGQFAPTYFAPTYFPRPTGVVVTPEVGGTFTETPRSLTFTETARPLTFPDDNSRA